MNEEERKPFAQFCIVELMGHRRLAGFVTEEEIAGAGILRIDIPGDDDHAPATQYYAPSAIYALTPTTEQIARQAAKRSRPAPIQAWELPLRTQSIVCYHCDAPTSALYHVVGRKILCQTCYNDLDAEDEAGDSRVNDTGI